ncbi:MAG TPA: hypothetical protein VF612_11315 [Jatrophihabitans sp.]|jgi:hypothetical protein|uniref:hypothetical protein n=1 Tax=Jatrophihabitans sp. TaxID=1932789 RepID=UPI002EFF2FD9
MSDIECAQSDTEAACCINAGCGNRFDPMCEGFNGECDWCAALAADHFTGAHRGLQLDCSFCFAADAGQAHRGLVTAA